MQAYYSPRPGIGESAKPEFEDFFDAVDHKIFCHSAPEATEYLAAKHARNTNIKDILVRRDK
jgi:hypothetical protein